MGSNPPFSIPIGTSDPLDLCSGLPLFPDFGTARAGLSASSRSYKLFDTAILIVCTRLKISAYAGYGFGVCGPSVAFLGKSVLVKRDNSPTEGLLDLTFRDGLRMQAGGFVGAYVAGGLTLTLQIYLPKPWFKFWAFTWQNLFSVEKNFKIDLLALMFKLISYLLSKRANNNSTFTTDNENRLKETQLDIKSFNFAGSSNAVTPNLTATPQVTAPLNLANYVPELKVLNLALAKIDGEVSFGPSVHVQYPVTLNVTGFTVTGGLQGTATTADYGNVNYVGGNRVTARGNTLFNLLQNPTRFTTHVKYQTVVKFVISIHFKVKLSKFFNLEVNTPSLDLSYLLFRIRESNRTVPVDNSVSTNVNGACVLTPNMTLTFEGPNTADIKTGELAKGTVALAGFQSQNPATVALEIEPPVPNFPTSVTIEPGSRSAMFPFTIPNQCLASGNRNDPNVTAAATPISPVQTYLVRAKLTPPSTLPCTNYEVEVPLNITNRFVRCQGFRTPEGVPPPWDKLASATIKADIAESPTGGTNVLCHLWFPYASNEQPQTVPVTFTLLDENRMPYSRSDVELIVTNTDRGFLTPSRTFNVRILTEDQAANAQNPSISIHWNSRGQRTGYSNRFFLVVDAGCQFGQTEFWLDVYNWS